MDFYQHPAALVESTHIGKNTRIWAFAHILPGAVVGEDCNICDHTFIENDVVIGNRVTIKCGVQLWDGVAIEDDVFIGPNASFSNNSYPRSKHRPAEFARTLVRQEASIGANATILPGLTIGRGAMVGAGAVVTSDVPPFAIVTGNPARIKGYDSAYRQRLSPAISDEVKSVEDIVVRGVRVYHLPFIPDMRGNLSFAEIGNGLPFLPKRYFLIFDVPSKEVRGEHAHRSLHQFLVCVKGSCYVMVDDGEKRAEVLLDSPTIGIYIPPMVWAVQYNCLPEAVLLVLASDVYKPEDYIRDYEEYLEETGRQC